MLTCEDGPKTLWAPAERAARLDLLRAPHMASLTEFVENVRRTVGASDGVPFFDPCDGGVSARALFLLEAPGAKAKLSGFVSRNNPDETAKNSFELHREARLPRREVVLWNVVPWYVGSEGRIRPVGYADLVRATQYLKELVALLPGLQSIVLVGRKAQTVQSQLEDLGIRIFRSPHPSPVPLRTNPNSRIEILRVWQDVAAFLGVNGPNAA